MEPAIFEPWSFRGDEPLKHLQLSPHVVQDSTREDGQVFVSADRDRRPRFPDGQRDDVLPPLQEG